MQVRPLTDWATYCGSADLPASRWVAHPAGGDAFASAGGDVVVAVGPEGGFTDDEVEMARSAGWRVASLGPRVLRVETAAIAMAIGAIRSC
jgi:16S rRNA (uracil1498-N3)-methyltransferase